MGARVLVHKSIYNEFMAKLTEKASRIRMGDPMDINTQVNTDVLTYSLVAQLYNVLQMGPVISHASRSRIDEMIKKAVNQGAKVRTGGCIPELPAPWSAGSYYSPTVIEVDRTMNIWKEEVIGVSILPHIKIFKKKQ